MKSIPGGKPEKSSKHRTSPWVKVTPCFCNCQMLDSLPRRTRLSMATTSCPRSRTYSASWEPRNPQPPVIRTFKVSYLRRDAPRCAFRTRRKPQTEVAIWEIAQSNKVESQKIKALGVQVTPNQIEKRTPEMNE